MGGAHVRVGMCMDSRVHGRVEICAHGRVGMCVQGYVWERGVSCGQMGGDTAHRS